jgi:excisionase family DNA binding protein
MPAKTAAKPAEPPISPPNWTVADVAEYCGITIRTVQKLIADGRLPAVRIGPRIVRIRRSDVERLLQPYGGAA